MKRNRFVALQNELFRLFKQTFD
ncbi:Protein of unknown function [Bacillus cereus]|nr:Protein of unknown function [Bacillus cereus]